MQSTANEQTSASHPSSVAVAADGVAHRPDLEVHGHAVARLTCDVNANHCPVAVEELVRVKQTRDARAAGAGQEREEGREGLGARRGQARKVRGIECML